MGRAAEALRSLPGGHHNKELFDLVAAGIDWFNDRGWIRVKDLHPSVVMTPAPNYVSPPGSGLFYLVGIWVDWMVNGIVCGSSWWRGQNRDQFYVDLEGASNASDWLLAAALYHELLHMWDVYVFTRDDPSAGSEPKTIEDKRRLLLREIACYQQEIVVLITAIAEGHVTDDQGKKAVEERIDFLDKEVERLKKEYQDTFGS